MQNKLIINTVKYFFYFGCTLLISFFSITFNGCSGSEEDIVDEQRIADSTEVYSKLQKGFTFYKSALSYNELSDGKNANIAFELSLNSLNQINYELISKGENYFWKKDFDELSQSIVEDYLTTQSEIPENSLVFEFARRFSINFDKIEEVSSEREPLPDGSDVPLIRNSVVDGYIEFFSNTERGRSFMDKSLYRSGKYFPLMRKILKYNNAPEELIYLSVQESGLNPTIVSKAGAVGLWQFMPATGLSYGLSSDGYRDDRRDFEKATDAAAHLLKDLYKTYNDWYLAFSAYNAGPGRVNKAIRNSGSRDFWSLRGNLPGETKNYTPSILALSFVMRNPEEYGFKDVEYGSQISFDRVEIQSQISLQRVAELCETDIETIRDLNTELTGDMIPDYNEPYLLRIPHNSFDKFLANYNNASDIDKSGASPSFAGNESGNYGSEVTGVQYKVKNYDPADVRLIGSTTGLKMIDHKYKKNEPLPAIASFYKVRATDIRIWNNLNYGIIPMKNQSLSVYISEEKYKLLQGLKESNEDPEKLKMQKEFAENNNAVVTDNNSKQNNNSESKSNSKTEEGTAKENNTTIQTETAQTLNDKTAVPEPETVQNNDEDSFIKNQKVADTPEISQPNSETSVVQETNESVSSESESVVETVEEPAQDESNSEVTNTYSNDNSSETGTKNKGMVSKYYIVIEGDNLSSIAEKNSATVAELKEWNNLETDKIIIGQKLKIFSGDVKTSVHIVSEGENLTMIANEYGLSVEDLKEMNGLKEDVIYSGQKLKVTETKTSGKNSAKTNSVKKTYKVKKGETLASIADKNNVTIKDLKSWNGLKSDKVMVGQVLKLYK